MASDDALIAPASRCWEEGLDIGDVDLIVCYDALGSATRNTQRHGRTGRKHAGRVVTLVTQGFEEQVSAADGL